MSPEIELKFCGFLFLSSPHLGSGEADWSKYLVSLAELIVGVREDVVNSLRSFNPLSAHINEDFGNIKVHQPYECFYETKATKVAGKCRIVVTKASATLYGKAASPIPGVDHNTICKYDSKFQGGYRIIVTSLMRLKELLSSNVIGAVQPNGMSPTDAHYYPLPQHKKWYEGKGLRPDTQLKSLKGRMQELQLLDKLVVTCQQSDASAIAITGIGGIGKTEILLEIAYQRLGQINIFFLRASDQVSLEEAYFHIARRLGHDILLDNYRGQPTLEIWNNMSREEKVEKFRDWLKRPENTETLFILDDLDGLMDAELIASAVPHEAKSVLFSTRNPVLHEELSRQTHRFRLTSIQSDDAVELMVDVLERTGYNGDGDALNRGILRQIAVALHGHPLACVIAIRYITRVISQEGSDFPEQIFLDILNSADFETRKRFLGIDPADPPSWIHSSCPETDFETPMAELGNSCNLLLSSRPTIGLWTSESSSTIVPVLSTQQTFQTMTSWLRRTLRSQKFSQNSRQSRSASECKVQSLPSFILCGLNAHCTQWEKVVV